MPIREEDVSHRIPGESPYFKVNPFISSEANNLMTRLVYLIIQPTRSLSVANTTVGHIAVLSRCRRRDATITEPGDCNVNTNTSQERNESVDAGGYLDSISGSVAKMLHSFFVYNSLGLLCMIRVLMSVNCSDTVAIR